MAAPDAVVVGSGPNGLSAAVALAQAGRSVVVREQADRIGGGMRTEELTLPGFRHDVCSTVHPLALSSPFFRTLPLEEHGLEWVHSPACLAHPFDDGSVAVLERSMAATGATLGPDARAWERLLGRWVDRWPVLAEDILGPLEFPDHPLMLAHFGLYGVRSAYCRGEAQLPGRARAGAVRRQRGALHGAAHRLAHGRVRADAGGGRARGGVAGGAGRLAEHRRRARLATCARWAARSSPARPWRTWTSCAACTPSCWT